MSSKIKTNHTETKGSFIYQEDGKVGGEMTFSKAGTDKIIIDHMEVSYDFRGKVLVWH